MVALVQQPLTVKNAKLLSRGILANTGNRVFANDHRMVMVAVATETDEVLSSKSSSRYIPSGIARCSGDHFDLGWPAVASGAGSAGIGSAHAVFQPPATSRNGS
jgi:hypothetical protein